VNTLELGTFERLRSPEGNKAKKLNNANLILLWNKVYLLPLTNN
jgi:hypothetical protein